MKLLLSPDPAEGGAPTPAAPAPAPAAPSPAAKTVLEGQRTEREIELGAELIAERTSHAATAGEKKARENRISELEDQLHQIKSAIGVKKKKSGGWTFFDGDEDGEGN